MVNRTEVAAVRGVGMGEVEGMGAWKGGEGGGVQTERCGVQHDAVQSYGVFSIERSCCKSCTASLPASDRPLGERETIKGRSFM